MHVVYEKLRALKLEVRKWERIKKRVMSKDLSYMEEMARLDKIMDNGNPSPALIDKIKDMEDKKRKILHIQEAIWRVQSKALWLKERGKNTKKKKS